MTGRPRELQDTIIDRTTQRLEHVFGMGLHELPEKKGHYILVNKLFQTGLLSSTKPLFHTVKYGNTGCGVFKWGV